MPIDSWMLDVPAQRAFDEGSEITPTVRRWNFIGFDLSYDQLTNRLNIRGGGSSDWQESVLVATASTLPANTRVENTLTANANGSINAAGVDGVATLAIGDRLLIKDEALGAHNGIYELEQLGDGSTPWVMTRALLADESIEVTSGLTVFVSDGSANQLLFFTLVTPPPITLNSTPLTFVTTGGAAGSVEVRVEATNGTSPFAVPAAASIVGCRSTTGVITINLPSISAAPVGRALTIADEDGASGANLITVQADGAELIDGGNTFPIGVNFGALTIYNTGNRWKVR